MKMLLVLTIGIILVIFLYTVAPPSFLPHKPKFKKGDCFAEVLKGREFIHESIGNVFLVLEVGNTDYKVIEKDFDYLEKFGSYSSWDIRMIDNDNILIDCKSRAKK